MDNKEPASVPFVVYESAMEKADRHHSRLVVVIIVLITLLFLSNAFWLIAWSSYDYVDGYSVDVNAKDGGNANFIGHNGDIVNGTDKVRESKSKGEK